MKELKCPKCGNVFSVDEADYAVLLNQVRNQEFAAEVQRREQEIRQQMLNDQKVSDMSKEAGYQQQLRAQEQHFQQQYEQLRQQFQNQGNDLQRLQVQLQNYEQMKQQQLDNQRLMLQQQVQETLNRKEQEINNLKAAAELQRREATLHENALKEKHAQELKTQEELVAYYKDLKTRMSTKMVCETLEQHCATQFESYFRSLMPNAYFEKDNDASDGTKGDFIFRDSEDGVEYISIMFEMKNEMDTTATKHKNDDFLKKLDEDRRKKGCEFAVLVSLLEADNEIYNAGIVNKSHVYPKMYVIRPQFFVPFINLLVQTSKKSLEYKKQLIEARNKEVDVTNFEGKLDEFKTKFGRHYDQAARKFQDAIKHIDDTIAKLQKVREDLVGSENNLRLANQDTEALTIRKLTYKNPTMKLKFDEARAAAGAIEQDTLEPEAETVDVDVTEA